MTERYVVPLAKPAHRGRKARKPLPKVHAGGKRNRQPEGLRRHRLLEKQADKLWSFIVMAVKGPMCQRCGKRPAVHPHHMVSRRYRATRWIVVNGAALDAGCHMLVGQDGEENRELAHKLMGETAWASLNITKRLGKVDPALMIVALKQEIRNLGLEPRARERGLYF